MKSISQFIFEQLNNGQKLIVAYGGKFQPFHKGHNDIYQRLCRKFGKRNVYICTADINPSRAKDKRYRDNHVLTFDEKVEVMTTMFNIPETNIVCVKSPLFAKELTEMFPKDYALVYVWGRKDLDRIDQLGGIYAPYEDDEILKGYDEQIYYYVEENTRGVNISATEVRNAFRTMPEEQRKRYFTKIYGHFDEHIYNLLNKRINHVYESTENKNILTEMSAACGHIKHLHTDLTLTKNDIYDLIEAGLNGELEESVEKVDGQSSALTYRNGQYLFSYNAGFKTMEEILNTEVKSAYAREIFREAYSFVKQSFEYNNIDANVVFAHGHRQLDFEMLNIKMPNAIKYNRNAIIFHYLCDLDENDAKTGTRDRRGAEELARIIAENPIKDAKYEVVPPPYVKLTQLDRTQEKVKYMREIDKLWKSAGVRDNDTAFDYICGCVRNAIRSKGGHITNDKLEILTKRLLGQNKTHQATEKAYRDDKTRAIVADMIENDRDNAAMDAWDVYRVFIVKLTMSILNGFEQMVAMDIEGGKNYMKNVLRSAIAEIRGNEELNSTDKLRRAIARIEAIGGEDALLPSEGIVFTMNGKLYKIVGAFADYIAVANVIRDKMKKSNEI